MEIDLESDLGHVWIWGAKTWHPHLALKLAVKLQTSSAKCWAKLIWHP